MKKAHYLLVFLFIIVINVLIGETKTFAKCETLLTYTLASESDAVVHHASYKNGICFSQAERVRVHYSAALLDIGCTCLAFTKWFKDSILVCQDTMDFTISEIGLYELRVCNHTYSTFIVSNSPIPFTYDSLHFQVLNGQYQSQIGNILNYVIYRGERLKLKAVKRLNYLCPSSAEIVDASAQWYFNNISYTISAAGDTVCFDKEGIIGIRDTVLNVNSLYRIQLNIVDEAPHAQGTYLIPYPLSELPEGALSDNLHYIIVNSFGQKVEEGKVNGRAILRNNDAHSVLRSGLYLVLYYQGETNIPILTDKILVLRE